MTKQVFDYKTYLAQIPHKPGVYQYFNQEGKIIYVGKAKDLRNRVASYFNNRANLDGKTQKLIDKIRDIKFILVNNEYDALLLENNLIKEFQPQYNIMLKDGKGYPYIVINNEPFPRIHTSREYPKEGSSFYYGPYISGKVLFTVLDFIKKIYPLRTCNLNLSEANIKAGKFKACLEYQMGNCKAPCEGLQSAEDYRKNILEIKEILKGNIQDIQIDIQNDMEKFAREWNFEQAHLLKQKLSFLEKYETKSVIVSKTIRDLDVISIDSNETIAFVNYMKITNGSIVRVQTTEVKKCLQETDEELLKLVLIEMHNRFKSKAKEVIVPFEFTEEDLGFSLTIPKQGDKKKLLELSEKNARFAMKSQQEQQDHLNPAQKYERVLEKLKKDLNLPVLPHRIECFDNSNFQGSFPVSAMVVFINAKPSKKDYRLFNVKTVEGPNDFDTMKEALFRRYGNNSGNLPLPDLIIIDGGKGQLSAAVEALQELGLYEKVKIISIAKRLEEIFIPFDSIPIYLDKRSESLKVIQQLRDEAHRFGISHHRNRRSKGVITSELVQIEGIGKTSAEKLLKHFKSIQALKEATEEEILKVINKKQAQALNQYFSKQEKRDSF